MVLHMKLYDDLGAVYNSSEQVSKTTLTLKSSKSCSSGTELGGSLARPLPSDNSLAGQLLSLPVSSTYVLVLSPKLLRLHSFKSMSSTSAVPPPIGIQLFSTHVALDPALSIYRRFATPNTRNLIYLQSELSSLEARLLQLDAGADDVTRGNDVWAMPRSWLAMRNAGLKGEKDGGEEEAENGEM